MSKNIRSFDLQRLFDDSEDLSMDAQMNGEEDLDQEDFDLLNLLYEDTPKQASSVQNVFRVKSARDLHSKGFVRVANTANMLVRISEKDFWEMEKASDGQLVVKRLFDPSGKPVKA